MIRRYGPLPYSAAVVHGGPGAIGSLTCMAKKLAANNLGVLEPLQDTFTIRELIEELYNQLRNKTRQPLTIIGHSWGAWLTIMLAAEHPEAVKQIVLIGPGPLDKSYTPLLTENRLERLDPGEQALYKDLIVELENNCCETNYSQRIFELIKKADNFDTEECMDCRIADMNFNPKAYGMVWSEALKVREKDGFDTIVPKIQCPVHILHGERDPHPVEGTTSVFDRFEIPYNLTILPNSGHNPFHERMCSDFFYHKLISILNG